MEIIKQGNKPSKYKATCPDCNSIIAFDDKDIKDYFFTPTHVVCPVCKYKIRRVFWDRVD